MINQNTEIQKLYQNKAQWSAAVLRAMHLAYAQIAKGTNKAQAAGDYMKIKKELERIGYTVSFVGNVNKLTATPKANFTPESPSYDTVVIAAPYLYN
jgi:ABC-type transport system substrate-binding protein